MLLEAKETKLLSAPTLDERKEVRVILVYFLSALGLLIEMAAPAIKQIVKDLLQGNTKTFIKETFPRKKTTKQNLFELLFEFPSWGKGQKVSRALWRRPDTYWTVTRIEPSNGVWIIANLSSYQRIFHFII